MKVTTVFITALTQALLFAFGQAVSADPTQTPALKQLLATIRTDRAFDEKMLHKVDDLVGKEFYSKELATTVWPQALQQGKEGVLASTNLLDLFFEINQLLGTLKSSHTEFATTNDEIFYFLHGLFGSFKPALKVPMDYVGFVCGPPRFGFDTVRYVLDDSPASKAGIQVGDRITGVDGTTYIGQANFFGKADKAVVIDFERNGAHQRVELTPKQADDYAEYVRAIKQSAKTFRLGQHTIGYVHYWCGGQRAHDAFEDVLSNKLASCDGIVLDLRDGYGGNGSEDLDRLYRPSIAYPPMTMKQRNGKVYTDQMYYDKPVVALINDGARSGKELLAFSLKRSGRAKLVGINTAGAFLAGKMTVLDKRCILYLAVQDVTVAGARLEGLGVAPDIEVNDDHGQAGKNAQLERAEDELVKQIDKPKDGLVHSKTSN